LVFERNKKRKETGKIEGALTMNLMRDKRKDIHFNLNNVQRDYDE
jgi:hypothetical protein